MNKQKVNQTEHIEGKVSEKENLDSKMPQQDEQSVENKKSKTKQKELTKESSAERLQELEAECEQLKDANLRLLAEYENYRKRSMREKAELIKSGGETILVGILSVVDDFERGLAAIQENNETLALKEGMELIYKKLTTYLNQHGVIAIEAQYKDFDTDLHEAVTTVPAENESQRGKVVDCIQKGYFLHDKVIRYAKVVVAN